jgi:hypothetical protein
LMVVGIVGESAAGVLTEVERSRIEDFVL